MTPWTHIAGGIVAAAIVLFGIRSCQETSSTVAADSEATDEWAVAERLNPEFQGWNYTSEFDEMRDVRTERAELLADDYVSILTPKLILLRRPNGEKLVGIAGAPGALGAIQCDSSDNTIAIRADDGPVRKIRCSAGDPVPLDPELFDIVKSSRVLMLEIRTGLGQRRQFRFETKGLRL